MSVELPDSSPGVGVGMPAESPHAVVVRHPVSALRPAGSLPAWRERRIRELMEAQVGHHLPLERLAKECDLSVRHFTRAFRLSTGLSPHRYLLQLRLARARRLLLDPTLRLNDIANSCGFADQSHFTRVFSGAEKMTPGKWRRLNSNR